VYGNIVLVNCKSQGPSEIARNLSEVTAQPGFKPFIVFDLNGVLCHTRHIPRVSTTPYRSPEEMDYDGELDTLINRKAVRARPGLRAFLREVLDLAHVVIWSSMVLDNTEPIVRFLFAGLPNPCLVLGQEACDELFDERGAPVPKFGEGGGQQFLKVLRSRLWVGVPRLEGVPHRCWPTADNTLLVDDSPTKSVLNPPGTVVFPDTWDGHRKDTFLVSELAPYLRRLVRHPGSVPDFVLSNPIGNGPLPPTSHVYRAIRRLAEVNNLI
jgi:hypothetical protein